MRSRTQTYISLSNWRYKPSQNTCRSCPSQSDIRAEFGIKSDLIASHLVTPASVQPTTTPSPVFVSTVLAKTTYFEVSGCHNCLIEALMYRRLKFLIRVRPCSVSCCDGTPQYSFF